MPKRTILRKKINLAKVLAALDTTCPKCGYSIPPAEISRVDFEHMVCPKCGERFIPKKSSYQLDSR